MPSAGVWPFQRRWVFHRQAFDPISWQICVFHFMDLYSILMALVIQTLQSKDSLPSPPPWGLRLFVCLMGMRGGWRADGQIKDEFRRKSASHVQIQATWHFSLPRWPEGGDEVGRCRPQCLLPRQGNIPIAEMPAFAGHMILAADLVLL